MRRMIVLGTGLVLVLGVASAPVATADTAPGLSTGQARELITRYLTDRAVRVTGTGDVHTSGALTTIPSTDALAQRFARDATKLDEVRAYALTTPSRGYRKAEVEVTVDSVTAHGPTGVEVEATELTRLYFGHGDPKAPQYEAYKLDHDFSFTSASGVWTLTATAPRLKAGPPPPTQVGESAVLPPVTDESTAEPARSEVLAPAAVATAKSVGAVGSQVVPERPFGKATSSDVGTMAYDYQAMYDYAVTYWDDYNGDYRGFGNDCTNFVSQIMRAGGWADAPGFYQNNEYWWYNFLNQTYSWAGANNWGLFAQVHSHRTAPLGYVYQMLTTDVLEVDWDHPGEPGVPGDEVEGSADHAMFVTGILGQAGAADEIYLTYHTNDRLNVPFWGWLLPQTEARDTWYAHRT